MFPHDPDIPPLEELYARVSSMPMPPPLPPRISKRRMVALLLGAFFALFALTAGIAGFLAVLYAAIDGVGVSWLGLIGGNLATALAVSTCYLLRLPMRGWFMLYAAACVGALLLVPLGVGVIADGDGDAARGAADFLYETLTVLAAIPLAVVFASSLSGRLAERLGWQPARAPWRTTLGTVAAVITFSVAASLLLFPADVDTDSQRLLLETHAALGGNVFVTLAVIAVLVPIGEELLFRGFMMSAITEATNVYVAVAVTAAIFAPLHLGPAAFMEGTVLQTLVVYFGMGAILAVSAVISKSIVPAIVAHAVNNALATFGGLYG